MTTNPAVRVTAFHHQEGTITMTVHARLTLLIALGCTALPSVALAQAGAYQSYPPGVGRFELTAIAGYQLNTDASLAVGHLDIGDAPVYGAQLGVLTMPGSRAVLLWMYSDPTVQAVGAPALVGSLPFHVATHYFQLGGEHGVRREAIEVFGRLTMGASLFVPESIRLGNGTSVSLSDTWRFAFTIGTGLKVHLSPNIALRFDVGLAAPVYFSGGGVYAGTGGVALGVSGGLPILQWNFLGGLVFSP
jgi:opacity protein-like surface antigen